MNGVAAVRPAATVFAWSDTDREAHSRNGYSGPTQRLHRSVDGGDQATGVLELFDISSISVAPADPAMVYLDGLRIADGEARVVLLRSTDGGAHWQTRSSRPSPGAPTIAEITEDAVNPNGYRVVVDPRDPDVVYRDTGERVERSVDGGRTFTALRVRAG